MKGPVTHPFAQESGLLRPRAFSCRQTPQLLRRCTLQATYDAHHHPHHADLPLPFMVRRSRVAELLAAGPYLLVLLQSGLCGAFDASTGRWLCDVNADAGEVVSSRGCLGCVDLGVRVGGGLRLRHRFAAAAPIRP